MSVESVRKEIASNEQYRAQLKGTELDRLSEAGPSRTGRNIAIAIAAILVLGAILLGAGVFGHLSMGSFIAIGIDVAVALITVCYAYCLHKKANTTEEDLIRDQERLLGNGEKLKQAIRTLKYINPLSSELPQLLATLGGFRKEDELVQYTPGGPPLTPQELGFRIRIEEQELTNGFKPHRVFMLLDRWPHRKQEIENALKAHFGEEGFALIQAPRDSREIQLEEASADASAAPPPPLGVHAI